jgi:hypothetical protein
MKSRNAPRRTNHKQQLRAAINRANAQRSTGPRSPEGKATSSRNRFTHGFCGEFTLLPHEDQRAFKTLLNNLRVEHQPNSPTEHMLVDRLAQHHWLAQRAIHLQSLVFSDDRPLAEQEKSIALFLRYQVANERAFSKCLKDLREIKADRTNARVEFFKDQNRLSKEMRTLDESDNREYAVLALQEWYEFQRSLYEDADQPNPPAPPHPPDSPPPPAS